MYVEALEDDTLVSFKGFDQTNSLFFSDPYNKLEYSVDQQTWNEISTDGTATTINTGEKLYFRGECIDIRSDSNSDTNAVGIGMFIITKKHNIGGNIMSLLFGDNFEDKTDLTGYDYVFAQLFIDIMGIINGDEGKLVSAENLLLPATTLADSCYAAMFIGCTSLTFVPELPATILAANCYNNMFSSCTSLTSAPELPATTLALSCYEYMFHGCTSLVTAPELPATTLGNSCYAHMFWRCTSLTSAPELPATTLTERCYEGMFGGCTSLTSAPSILPATTLTERCYYSMFTDCTSFINAPELPATTLTESCYTHMFNGCTSLTSAPELFATILANSCYTYMFYGCKKLNNITMLATDISAYDCLLNWTYNVAPTGTFYKHPDMNSLPTGEDGIPSGWTVVDYAA